MAPTPLDPVVADLAAFELFLSVIELGSLSRAAVHHGVSQPAVSARLRGLERRLGFCLILRSSTGCRPTPQGLVVARAAETVMEAANALATTVATLHAEQASTVRLAASLTVAEHLLPQWLSRMRATHPDQAVELQVENSDRVVDLVRAGRVELGFVEAPEPPAGLASAQVATDRLVVICAPDHPWARRRRPVTPAELGATPLVVREEGAGGRQTLDLRFALLGIDPVRPAAEMASPTAISAAVATGVAPGVVSILAAAADVECGRLRCVEVVGLDLGRQFRAVWRSPARPPCLRWLLGV